MARVPSKEFYFLTVTLLILVVSSEDHVIRVAIVGPATQEMSSVLNISREIILQRKLLPSPWHLDITLFSWSCHNSNNSIAGLMKSDFKVLIGPDCVEGAKQVQPVAILKDAAFISLAVNREANSNYFTNIIAMSPLENHAKAITAILQYCKFLKISIISTDDADHSKFSNLIATTSLFNNIEVAAVYFIKDIRETLEKVLNNQSIHAIILTTTTDDTLVILKLAEQMNMTSASGWLFVVTDTSSHDLIKGNTQFTSLGILSVQAEHCYFNRDQLLLSTSLHLNTNLSQISKTTIESLLIAANGCKTAIQKSLSSKKVANFSSYEVIEAIVTSQIDGLSCPIIMDSATRTRFIKYHIYKLSEEKWSEMATWDYKDKLKHSEHNDVSSKTTKFHLKVTTIVEIPFVYFPDGSKDETKLQGFCIDFLNHLSKIADFTYEIHLVRDGNFGGYNKTNKVWNGMIGEVQQGVADLAVASITVTRPRSKVVNFLPSIMSINLKFIMHKNAKNKGMEYSAYAFLDPFESNLYYAIIVCVVLLAAFICLLSKISPYGTRGHFFHSSRVDEYNAMKAEKPRDAAKHKSQRRLCAEKDDADRGMGFNNALYFVWAALFWQTPERVPRSLSARVTTVCWYLAAVVFVATYTANMVAVVSRHSHAIESSQDLIMQDKVLFGTVENSAVETQLKSSGIRVAKQIYSFMLGENPEGRSLSVPNVEDGLELVRKGHYALFWDSMSLDYAAMASDCELLPKEAGFGVIKYAFAVGKKSPHFQRLSNALIRLKQQGLGEKLHKKYFDNIKTCDKKSNYYGDNRQLTFMDLAGVFYLVGYAMATGVVLLIAEWAVVSYYDVNKTNHLAPQTMLEAFSRRKSRLVVDIRNNWFPIENIVERWSSMTLPAHERASKIVQSRLAGSEHHHKVDKGEILRRARSSTNHMEAT